MQSVIESISKARNLANLLDFELFHSRLNDCERVGQLASSRCVSTNERYPRVLSLSSATATCSACFTTASTDRRTSCSTMLLLLVCDSSTSGRITQRDNARRFVQGAQPPQLQPQGSRFREKGKRSSLSGSFLERSSIEDALDMKDGEGNDWSCSVAGALHERCFDERPTPNMIVFWILIVRFGDEVPFLRSLVDRILSDCMEEASSDRNDDRGRICASL